MATTDVFMKLVTDSLKEHVPTAAAEALDKLAAEQSDKLASAALDIVSDFVRKNGVTGIDMLSENLRSLISGDNPSAVFALQSDGLFLSDLVDELQSAEADRKAEANKMIEEAASVLADVSKIVVKALAITVAG